MAKKISQLTQATQVKSDDVTVIVQDGETKKLPLNMMVTKQDIENKKVAGLAKLDEIEATYENDTYTPTITVKNKSSVKVGEGDGVDYSANVMDGPAKSAILKGQTLVNLFDTKNIKQRKAEKTSSVAGYDVATGTVHYITNLEATNPYNYSYVSTLELGSEGCAVNTLKPNTTYTVKWFYEKIEDTDPSKTVMYIGLSKNKWGSFSSSYLVQHPTIQDGSCVFTTPSEFPQDMTKSLSLGIMNPSNTLEYKVRYVVLEGDHANEDIPFFEGMQSVKMPVLTTTGKNLFNLPLIQKQSYAIEFDANSVTIQNGDGRNISELFGLKHKPNEQYTFIYDRERISGSGNSLFVFNYTDGTIQYVNPKTINVSSSSKTLSHISLSFSDIGVSKLSNICLVQGIDNELTYEPYKSNILTVNEEVELRGIGEGSNRVEDELDCLTGGVVERIGEVVLNGSENITLRNETLENTLLFVTHLTNINIKSNLIYSDKFDGTDISWDAIVNADKEFIRLYTNDTNALYIRILKSKLATQDVNGFKQWLSKNPITIQYKLATESIKTVDLMPSGTHPSTTPYCWKNGHIQLSSSGLLPNLEYSVVTSRAGQINQNATMVVKNDKRIFDLEILLAGGLVNTTYQALTLQNQVETGLSKASLNSETEPDYLLYHMIMKLIEEKAYKLDDLTEKVSVFYLYEKLSDEQFETIYSALYPFVEDEIVEEPVVEELPEVAEDEVIM